MFRVGEIVEPSVFQNLLEILKARKIAINRYRAKSGLGRSQAFGIVKQRNGKYAGSRLNFERMDVYKELQEIAQKILPKDFEYTSCQVNDNYLTSKHRDTGNRGESAIIGFGDYTKGELLIEGVSVDIKYKVIYFDGSIYEHATAFYIGQRYSLVFYRPTPIFLEIPTYKIITREDNKLYLEEDSMDIRRIYNKDGNCVECSDGRFPMRSMRKYSLREAIVLEKTECQTLIETSSEEDYM
jgi:hypothetical protein